MTISRTGRPRTARPFATPLAAAIALTLAAAPTYAQDSLDELPATTRAQSLGSAIEALAERTGTRIFFDPELVRGRSADGVAAPDDAEQALSQLLEGTGLELVRVDADTFRVVEAGTSRSLENIVVTGTRQARANALNRKRSAINIAEYALSDDISKLPDRNLADAVSRLPGVSVQGALGEGRFVSIRGLAPDLNQLTVNGQTSAISDVDARAGRAGPLDVVGAGDFASIEVTKSLTPDQNAQGLGGQINVNTPSALEVGRRFAFAQADYGGNDQNDQDDYSFSGGFGELFLDGRLGFYVGASWSQRDFIVERLEGEWDETDDGTVIPVRLEPKRIDEERTRQSVSTNIEYQFDNGSRLYTRLVYNKVEDEGRRDESEWEFDAEDAVLTSPTSGVGSGTGLETKTRQQDSDRSILNWTLGSDIIAGAWTVEPSFTFSTAEEDRSPLIFTEFDSIEGVDTNFDFSEWRFDFQPVALNPENFEFDKIRFDFPSVQEEDIYTPALDLGYDFGLANLFGQQAFITAHFGGKATLRDREVDEGSNRYASFDQILLPDFVQTNRPFIAQGVDFSPVEDPALLEQFFRDNPELFFFQERQSLTNSVEDDYDAEEDIFAGYAFAEAEIGKLRLLGGLRVEHTDFSVSGFEAVEVDGDFQGIEQRSEDNEYTNVFGNFQARYEFQPGLIGRFAFTQSIGRPDFVAAAPISELEVNEIEPGVFIGSLEEGNPDLEPFESNNFDLSLEWFFAEGGILSVTGFYKDIDNPIFERRLILDDIERRGRFFQTLRVDRTDNAEEGEIMGIELGYQQQFDFLPGLWSGLGIAANATFVDSEVEVFGREDDLPFFTQPDQIFNVQAFYEKGRVQARLAWQYTDENLRELGGNPNDDIWDKSITSLDAKITFQALENVFVFFEAENLTQANRRQFQGRSDRLFEDDRFGAVFRGGLSWRL